MRKTIARIGFVGIMLALIQSPGMAIALASGKWRAYIEINAGMLAIIFGSFIVAYLIQWCVENWD